MTLFLLKRRDENSGGYDEVYGFVVRAETELLARETAGGAAEAEGAKMWLDSEISSCAEVTTTGPEEIILRDFFAG